MASTLTLAGNADFNGNLDADGTTNLDNGDICCRYAGSVNIYNGDLILDGNADLMAT